MLLRNKSGSTQASVRNGKEHVSVADDQMFQCTPEAGQALLDQYEDTFEMVSSLIESVILGTPIAADDDRIVAELDPIADGSLTIAAQPDVPRNLTVTVTDGDTSITAGTVTITGEDVEGNTITDTLDFEDALTLTTTNIYAKVDSVVVADLAGEDGSGDTIKIGVGNVIGLPKTISASAAIKHVYLGGARVASPTIATGESKSGVDVNAATYNGSKLLQVIYDVMA